MRHSAAVVFALVVFVTACAGVEESQEPENQQTSLDADAKAALQRLNAALLANDARSLAVLMGRPELATDAEFAKWVNLQASGLASQFGSSIEFSRVESKLDEMRVFVRKAGLEHSKPLLLKRGPEGWRIVVGDSSLVSVTPGRTIQGALGDRYTWPFVLTNYTSSYQTVICDDAIGGVTSTFLGTVFYNSTVTANVPAWQCTWFGSTCTRARLQGCGSGCEKVCANQILGDDVWVNSSGVNCYIPWN